MAGEAGRDDDGVLETGRLLLRRRRVADATVLRALWAERDPRVPPHRRLDPDGHPTVAELADSIRADLPGPTGLLSVERRAEGDVIGYCGLVDGGPGAAAEPELAFELLREVWGRGYATEAAEAVVDWARSSRYERLWATVWEWNSRVSPGAGEGRVHRERSAGRRPRDHGGDHPAALTGRVTPVLEPYGKPALLADVPFARSGSTWLSHQGREPMVLPTLLCRRAPATTHGRVPPTACAATRRL